MLRLFLLITTLILTGKGARVQKDVFWREYDGYIPEDAVPIGHDLYIGQIVHKGRLIPGTINPETKTFYTQYNEKIEKTEDIKIMCSKNPDRFNWELADYTSLTDGILKRAVEGGYQTELRFYIGKVFHENEWKIGPAGLGAYRPLHVWNDDGSTHSVNPFEVLIYV